MSYSFGTDTKPGLLATMSSAPGSVTDPTQCPAGTHFTPDTREVGSPGTCLTNPSPPGALAKLGAFWNASVLNKVIIIAPLVIACLAVGYFRPGDEAEHGKATPNRRRRRMRKNHEARLYSAMEHRVRRASAADLRRMANWMVQGGGAREPQEKALLARIRGELSHRRGVSLPGQMYATPNVKLTATSKHLLREIAEGRPRVFFYSEQPTGWVHIERAGLAVRVPGTDRAELTAAGRAFMGMKPNGRRFRRNGYRVVGAGGLKVPQVFGAHHQAVQYGDKAFGERNYVVEFVFKANAARHVEHHLWLKKKYGLTGPQASQLVARSDIDAVLRKVDDWAFEHGAATSSPLVRGYFTDLLNGPERYGRNRRRRAA